jgi:ABC-type bacteriocin/lantibiotic exporter with double-glycine peptidase domain
MVLSDFGLLLSEEELCSCCDCTIFGTDALKAVNAARQLGFSQTIKTNLSIVEDLLCQIDLGVYPIVYINLQPISGENCQHAVVVVEVKEETICIYDPLSGERKISHLIFDEAWSATKRLSILVRR